MTKRDFHGDTYYIWMQQQFEAIRQRRKAFKGKPDAYDRIEIELDRAFEKYFREQS